MPGVPRVEQCDNASCHRLGALWSRFPRLLARGLCLHESCDIDLRCRSPGSRPVPVVVSWSLGGAWIGRKRGRRMTEGREEGRTSPCGGLDHPRTDELVVGLRTRLPGDAVPPWTVLLVLPTPSGVVCHGRGPPMDVRPRHPLSWTVARARDGISAVGNWTKPSGPYSIPRPSDTALRWGCAGELWIDGDLQ